MRRCCRSCPKARNRATGRSPATTWRWCCRRSASAPPTPGSSAKRWRSSANRSRCSSDEKDDLNWAAAQNNIGNVLLALGQREKGSKLLEESVAAFRETLKKRDRAVVPLDWAATQNNIGIALFNLSEREAGTERLAEAEAAYRLALEEYTSDRTPVEWAMVQNNLGNTLSALALCKERRRSVQAGRRHFPRCDAGEDARASADAMGGHPAQSRRHAEQYRQVRTGNGEPRRGGERPQAMRLPSSRAT